MRPVFAFAALMTIAAPALAQDAPEPKLDYQKLLDERLEALSGGDAKPTDDTDASDPAAIEASTGGRMGIAMVDARGKILLGFNKDERFAMCSTFKAPLAAAILMGAEKGRYGMDGSLSFTSKDILEYAPVVSAAKARGRLTIAELAKGTVEVSDNSAANLLLPLVGGPEGLTSFMRDHGDTVTRMDRTEPSLNENAEGDPRDTTSPAAMATVMARLLFADMPRERAGTLRGWLEGSTTGGKRIRAGMPGGWTVGSKTGTCGNAVNDVAVLRSPNGNSFVLAIYVDRPTVSTAKAEAAIAKAAQAVIAELRERAGPRRDDSQQQPTTR